MCRSFVGLYAAIGDAYDATADSGNISKKMSKTFFDLRLSYEQGPLRCLRGQEERGAGI